MKRIVYVLVILLIQTLITSVFAGERTKEEMRKAALNVLSINNKTRGVATNASDLKEYLTKEKLSVFGSEELGFAVVTNDDRFDEVIGYSVSTFSSEMPCGFKWWLEAANEVMENVKGQIPVGARVRGATRRSSVGPLITTKWGQNKPYNNKCILSIEGKDYSLVTGCVATAMAQVMKYYKYPKKGKGEKSYIKKYIYNSSVIEHKFYSKFEDSYYDWNNMLDDYSGYRYSNSQDQYTNAVSLLMSDCGIAVNMDYNIGTSGANPNNIPIGLEKYFPLSHPSFHFSVNHGCGNNGKCSTSFS